MKIFRINVRGGTALAVCLGAVSMLAITPTPSLAQKCTTFACKVKAIAKKLDSATTPGSTAADTRSPSAGIDVRIPTGPVPEVGATGSTGVVRFQALVLQWKVIDDGTQLRAAPPPPAPEIRRQVLGCGPDRACVATADLRVIGIETYGQSLANNTPFIVDVLLENHGRRATATTEGRICTNGLSGVKCNDGLSDTFIIPVVQPGERVTIRRSLNGKLEGYSSTREVAVVVDPDESIADFSRANNAMVAKDVKVEEPAITTVQTRSPVETTIDRSFQPIHMLRLQNPSRSIATGEIPMLVQFLNGDNNCRVKYENEPLTLPSVPPKAVVEFAIIFPRVFASCSPGIQILFGSEPTVDSPNSLSVLPKWTSLRFVSPSR